MAVTAIKQIVGLTQAKQKNRGAMEPFCSNGLPRGRGELWGWVVHSRKPLAGYNFLIIEDEPMQAWRIGEILADLGGVIGKIAYSYEQGQEALADGKWDCVIVDINLNGEPSFPLVKIIEKQGVPYIYCSAYIEALVGIFPEAESAVRVSKPVTPERLQSAVLLALSH